MTGPAHDNAVPYGDLVRSTRDEAARIFAEYGHAFVYFSGGKDSVVVADLVRPWKDRVGLIWVNTGDTPPGMPAFVRSYGDDFRLIELHSDPRASWERYGLPADIASADMSIPAVPGHKVQLWPACCARNRTLPMRQFVLGVGLQLLQQGISPAVIHGQREDDHAFTLEEEQTYNAFPTPFGLLWNWSEDDVMRYIEEQSLPLAPHYAEYRGSMDCKSCPADMSAGRRRFLERHFPDIGQQADEQSATVLDFAEQEMDRLRSARGEGAAR